MPAAADFDAAVAEFGEAAFFQMQHAAGAGQMIGIGLFVKRMGGRRFAREIAQRGERFQNETVAGERAERAIGAAAGRGGDRAAFENLAHVDGQARIVAEHDRQRGEVGRIVASPASTTLQSGLEGPA